MYWRQLGTRPSATTMLARLWHYTSTQESYSWWRNQMETFSALLAICAGNSPVPGEFPAQRPVTRSFDVFFDLRLNKPLSKQSWGWWFETLSRPLWRHCNVRDTKYLTEISNGQEIGRSDTYYFIANKQSKVRCREVDYPLFLAALRKLLSIRPSVCPSACQTFLTMFLSSYRPEIFRSYYHCQTWCPCKRSRSEVKVQGHRGHDPICRFWTVTPVCIHIWWWNDAQGLMLLTRGALLFFKVSRQISRSCGTINCRFGPVGRFRTVTPVWIHRWIWNDAQSLP